MVSSVNLFFTLNSVTLITHIATLLTVIPKQALISMQFSETVIKVQQPLQTAPIPRSKNPLPWRKVTRWIVKTHSCKIFHSGLWMHASMCVKCSMTLLMGTRIRHCTTGSKETLNHSCAKLPMAISCVLQPCVPNFINCNWSTVNALSWSARLPPIFKRDRVVSVQSEIYRFLYMFVSNTLRRTRTGEGELFHRKDAWICGRPNWTKKNTKYRCSALPKWTINQYGVSIRMVLCLSLVSLGESF